MKNYSEKKVKIILQRNGRYLVDLVDIRSKQNQGYRLFAAVLGTSPLWLGVLFFVYGPANGTGKSPLLNSVNTGNMADLNQASFWNTADMTKLPVPMEIKEHSNRVQIKESRTKVQDADVFYREAGDDGDFEISLLLLHGMAFSSKTWLDLGTIKLMAAIGYRVVAVDLPGYGESPAATINDKGEFLHQLIQKLKLKRPVIVSPSMSGTFALPYLLNHWTEMGGYIPVAPIGWDVLENYKQCNIENPESVQKAPETLKQYLQPPIPDLDCVQVPALVVYGENDRSRSSALLSLLPFSQAFEIPKGSHPAYLTDPELWHKLLFNFLGYTETYASQKSN